MFAEANIVTVITMTTLLQEQSFPAPTQFGPGFSADFVAVRLVIPMVILISLQDKSTVLVPPMATAL